MLVTPLDELVPKYFPDEKILKTSKVKILGTVNNRVGKIPYSFTILFSFLPVDFLETDKKMYIDWRKYYALVAVYGVLLAPLLFVVSAHLLFVYIGKSPDFEFYTTAIILGLIFSIVRIPLQLILMNIRSIDKRWIEEDSRHDNQRVVKVKIPNEDFFYYYFTYNVPLQKHRTLPLIDKLMTIDKPLRLIGMQRSLIKPMTLSTNFTIKFKEVQK